MCATALLLVTLISSALAQRCFFPDATEADSSWTACNAAVDVTHCCYRGDACLDNGYCFSQETPNGFPNRLLRGACTDITWSSPNCPEYCRTVSSSGQQTIALVSDQEDGYFCCGFGDNFWNGSSCTSESTRNNYDAFVLDPPTVIIDRADGLTLQNNPSHSSRPVVTVTTTAAGRTVTATPSSKPSNNKDVIAAGVGAAVPLGCLLAAAIAFLILGRRQVKRLKNENSTQKEEIEEQRRELESAWSQAKIGRAHVAGTNRNPAELEADRVAAELDNGERQSLVGERDTKHVYR